MSRRELMAEVKRLRSAPSRHDKLEEVVHDLRVYQEQLSAQRDQLMTAQAQLERSRDIYADLYDYAPLAYVTLDEYGVVLNINLTGTELLGNERLALSRIPFMRYVLHDDRRKFLDHMRRCRVETGSVMTELMLLLANGETIPTQLTTRASVPPGSSAVEYRTAIIDLRMLRAAEAARARAERERLRLEREDERLRAAIEAKDEFLAVLSHELRTPLTPILAFSSSLQGRSDVPEPLRSDLACIQRNVELETRLIDDLLDMTRAARGTLSLACETVDLHALLRETVVLCEGDRPPGVVIRWSLGAAEHHLHADPVRLRQIFWNLVRNAFQSIEGDGQVLLRTMNDALGRVTIAVRDSGVGIDGADLDRIFLPFYQPRGGRHGRLGLGLAITKSLVEAHAGHIAVTSAGPGRGACFQIDLQTVTLSAAERQTTVSAPAQPPGAAPVRVAVLLVEDNVDSGDALSQALRLEGFDVRLVGSLSDAREAARQRFDVVVSDLALPDGSGLDLIAELRAHSTVPAIALSGYGSESDKSRSAAAGFSEHLTKPVTIERLRDTIRRLVPGA